MTGGPTRTTRKADSGVTLIEVLVVLVLIATLAGALVVSLSPNRTSDATQTAAAQIKQSLDNAIAKSLLSPQGFALEWQQNRFRITGKDTPEWTELPSSVQLRSNQISPYQTSDAFVPNAAKPLVLQACRAALCVAVIFDGYHTRIEQAGALG